MMESKPKRMYAINIKNLNITICTFTKVEFVSFFATLIFLAQLTKSANPNSILSENLSVISGVRKTKKLEQLNGVKDFFPAFFSVSSV